METLSVNNAGKNWLILIVVGGLFYLIGQYIASQPQRVQQEVEANREIAVQGYGEVQARPDIAQLQLGVTTGVQSSAAVAMDLLSKRFTAVEKAIRNQGVKEEDIKTTNLTIQPTYDYSDGRQSLRGFEASESVEVRIRDLTKIGTILSAATGEGVNQAGGISFTIDDPTELEQQAQKAAIENARENAEALARSLNVNLGRVKSFQASSQPKSQPPIYAAEALSARGVDSIAAPPVPSGSQEISANVTVTYELR